MSQRGHGPGPVDDEPGTGERDRLSDYSFSRPIQPYDPYRKSEEPRRPSRNVAAESESLRRVSRTRSSPFLDDDDPLSASAWEVDDEVDVVAFDEPGDEPYDAEFDEPSPTPRRARRRQAPAGSVGTGRRRTARRAAAGATAGRAATRGPRMP
ncbi:MAG: hypothetical protein KC442_23300, partial [Thermomicrobiales bacterium]|nr:hypothetical protein [Thermomicrobiales bacterium]